MSMDNKDVPERDDLFAPHPPDPAEARVRELRDALVRTAAALQASGGVDVREAHGIARAGLEALEDGDLGPDHSMVTRQLRACLRHLEGVAERRQEPIPPEEEGLSADARFLRDLAEFLTRKFVGDEEPPEEDRKPRSLPVLPRG